MKAKPIALLLVFVILASVTASGCLGGNNGKQINSTGENTSQTSSVSPKNIEIVAPNTITVNGKNIKFSIKIRTNGEINIEGVSAFLKYDGKKLNLDTTTPAPVDGGYEVGLSYTLPDSESINTRAKLTVIIHTAGETITKEATVTLVIKPVQHEVSINIQPKSKEISVSQTFQDPLIVVASIKSDIDGTAVITKVEDEKGFVTGLGTVSNIFFRKGLGNYYIYVEYDADKVYSSGGGQDTITVEGYYYTKDEPGKKIKFSKKVQVFFDVKQPSIDFSTFDDFTVINAIFYTNRSKQYSILLVRIIPPFGLADGVKVSFSVDYPQDGTPLSSIDKNQIVAVAGSLNGSDIYSVFESGKKSDGPVVEVHRDSPVVNLLIRVNDVPATPEDIMNYVGSHFIVKMRVLGAELNGVWKSPDREVSVEKLVAVEGAVDLTMGGRSCDGGNCTLSLGSLMHKVSFYEVSKPINVVEAKLTINYPYPRDENQTVRISIGFERNVSYVVSTVPMSLSQLLNVFYNNGTTSGTVSLYLPFGGGVIAHDLYIYIVPKDDGPIGSRFTLLINASTEGTNGDKASFRLTASVVKEKTFVYFYNTYPAVNIVKKYDGLALTPIEPPYLSWYYGAKLLYELGIPGNLTRDFYFPVVFIPPKPGDYYVKVLPLNTTKVKMKPLARIGNYGQYETTAYYSVVKVSLDYPVGFYPVEVVVYDANDNIVAREETFMNPAILSFLSQLDYNSSIQRLIYPAVMLDRYISDAGRNYILKRIMMWRKVDEKNTPIYVSEGKLYYFDGDKPEYVMELGYFTFNFSDDGTVMASFEDAFKNVSTYKDFKKAIETGENGWNKLFGVNLLVNPSRLAYVKLNPGDEKRVINEAFVMPVKRENIKDEKFVLIMNGVLYYTTITRNGLILVKTSDGDYKPSVKSGYYLVQPDEGKYNVGGHDFIESSEKPPFYEVKVIYVPDGKKHDFKNLKVLVNGKKARIVYTKDGLARVVNNYYSFLTDKTPSVVIKPYYHFVVLDIYGASDEPIRTIEIAEGNRTVFKKTISERESTYLTFLNFYDVGLLPDFGFYTFDWLEPKKR